MGSFLVEGQPPKGQAGIRLQDMILSGSRFAEQSMEKERIPSDLKEIPKHYFEGITEGQ